MTDRRDVAHQLREMAVSNGLITIEPQLALLLANDLETLAFMLENTYGDDPLFTDPLEEDLTYDF